MVNENDEGQCSKGITLSPDIYVGYGNVFINAIMIIFSICGIIINSIFSFNYLKQMIQTKNKENKGLSAVEKILCMVAMVETIISICWLLNNFFMSNTQNMSNNCFWCKIVAHIEIFFYLFDWMILSTSLYQIKIILLQPEKILESGKTVIKYLIICLAVSLGSLIFSIGADIGGVSPLLTCFINIHNLESYKIAFFWIFFTLPIFCFIFGFVNVFLIMRSNEYKEKDNRNFFIEYSYFVITYIIFSLFLIITYIINFIIIKGSKSTLNNNGYQIYITGVTLLSCSTPLIVGLIRSFRTGLLKRLFRKKRSADIEQQLLETGGIIEERPMVNLEQRLLEQLIIKYFTAISYVLGKSKHRDNQGGNIEDEGTEGDDKLERKNSFNAMEHDDYKITKNEILKDMDLAINEDIKVLEEANIDIEITEYNPTVFKQLRELEGFNEDTLISMFQPKKGTSQLIQKKNETIYINSINKLLMLKEIKKDKLIYFQRNILPGLYSHLVKNPDSLICRVFGLFRLKIEQKEDVYMALIYNINDSIDMINNNIIKTKNDVKQMKISLNELNENIVVDNNQKNDGNNKIFKLNLNKEENDKLADILNKDAQFLKEKNINRFKILVFEKNMEEKDRVSLFNERKSENKVKLDPKSQISNNIKKYVFNSSLPNIIYSICILDFFKSNN